MRPLIVKQLKCDLTPVAGLALVGHHLKRLNPVFDEIDRALPARTGVKTSDIVRSYVGLLVQGKSDFDAMESIQGVTRPARRVLRLIERTIDSRGQHLIQPEFQLDGWATSLSREKFSGQDIIALYADHGTHEQFHSEFKTDLDLERLPSGKFDTNYMVCALAALTMNILRLLGQAALHGPDAPVRHEAKRRRLKTVMQELVYRAGRLIKTGRRLILGLGANDRAANAFTRVHGELFAACG